AGDPTVQPWNRFDMIIVDEAHSLLSDATYQSSAFYVRRLIEETLKNFKTCKVIVMTGSPKILEKHPVIQKAHLIDRMKTCINVTPKSVRFITKEESAALQQQMLMQHYKFIAFYNHVSDILALDEELPAEASAGIAMAFSKATVLDQMKKDHDPRLQRMLDTQAYLAQHEKLPDDVYAFLSTSKNKEGINIKNSDIHAMFVETHAELGIVIGEGIEHIVVVFEGFGLVQTEVFKPVTAIEQPLNALYANIYIRTGGIQLAIAAYKLCVKIGHFLIQLYNIGRILAYIFT
ncbi:MAG: hypothetical protein PUD63_03495, partial [Clostridia bacterium]|nr:hypothetical protein [Clostridia bacterium]